MPFEIGNQYGRQTALLTEQLRRVVRTDDYRLIRKGVHAALVQASRGSLPHLAWCFDRLDGRVAQRVDVHRTDDARAFTLEDLAHAIMQARAAEATDAEAIDHDATIDAADGAASVPQSRGIVKR